MGENGVRFEINQLVFTDNIALVADSARNISGLVNEFRTPCE